MVFPASLCSWNSLFSRYSLSLLNTISSEKRSLFQLQELFRKRNLKRMFKQRKREHSAVTTLIFSRLKDCGTNKTKSLIFLKFHFVSLIRFSKIIPGPFSRRRDFLLCPSWRVFWSARSQRRRKNYNFQDVDNGVRTDGGRCSYQQSIRRSRPNRYQEENRLLSAIRRLEPDFDECRAH